MGKKGKVKIIYNIGCPEWMLTMGDCMSLLLCFFVLLMVFSTPDQSKLMTVFGCLQGALGASEPPILKKAEISKIKPDDEGAEGGEVEDGVKEALSIDKENLSPVKLKSIKIKNLYNDFRNTIEEIGFRNVVSTEQIDEGIVVRLPADAMFMKGTHDLNNAVRPMLQNFSNLAGSVGNELRITIYFTEEMNKAESARFEMGLARDRLVALCNYLHSKYSIARTRMSYGFAVSPVFKEPMVELLLAEVHGTQEINFEALLKK